MKVCFFSQRQRGARESAAMMLMSFALLPIVCTSYVHRAVAAHRKRMQSPRHMARFCDALGIRAAAQRSGRLNVTHVHEHTTLTLTLVHSTRA